MVRKSVLTFSVFLFPLFSITTLAQQNPLIGTWKTIDDKTQKEKSLVEIYVDEEGNIKGKIVKLFRRPEEDQNPVCDKCEGDKKNAPLTGMEILWGFSEKNMKDNHTWIAGNILDPKTGVQYSCNMTLNEAGDTLQIRGYIGFSLIGRNQTWMRVTDKE